MLKQNNFILVLNSKEFEIPFLFNNLVHINPIIFQELINNHTYHVTSDVSFSVFESFLNYLVYQKSPNITEDNIKEYSKINTEFQLEKLDDLIQMKKIEQEIIDLNALICETNMKNKIKLESIISSNLDEYLNKYYIQFFRLPIDSLYRIFANPSRKLTKQDLAYKLIKQYSFYDSSVFKLLPTLDASKLSEKHLKDSISKRKLHENQIPNFDNLYLLDEIERMKEKFKQMSEYLVNKEFKNISERIEKVIDEYDIEKVKWLTREEIEDENGIVYKIDRQNKQASIFGLRKPSKNILIPRTIKKGDEEFIIKSIYEEAFKENDTINTIEFDPNSEIEIIKKLAFCHSSIRYISIPSSIKIVEECAFAECNNLATFEIPRNSKLEIIGEFAFILSNIEKIYIPSNVTVIGKKAFAYCNKLKTIEISEESKSLTFEKRSFDEASVDELIIPSEKVQINECAFQNCYNLKIIEITNEMGFTSINHCAFFESTIETLIIKSKQIKFENNWCSDANNLKKIVLSQNNKDYIFKDEEFLLSKRDNTKDEFDILLFAKRDIEHVKIPSFIKVIAQNAFNSCISIETIEFPENSQLKEIGYESFKSSSIEKLILPSHVAIIDSCAFCDCYNLQTIEILENSDKVLIKQSAFAESPIETLIIKSSQFEFERGWCSGASNLNKIVLSKNNKDYFLKDEKLLLSKTDKTKDEFDVLLFARRDIKHVIIPSFIKVIADSAFRNCEALKSIDFSNDSKLTEICAFSFNCTSIESIIIPSHVKIIGTSSFCDCQQLKKIEITENSELISIESNAFSSTSIVSFSVPSSVIKIEKNAFLNCNLLQIIELSENLQSRSFDESSLLFSPNIIVMVPLMGKF